MVEQPIEKLSDSNVPSVGTKALNECPEPTGRILPGAWRMTCTNSARSLGASRSRGRQLCAPDQLRQGINRGARANWASAGLLLIAMNAPATAERCNSCLRESTITYPIILIGCEHRP